MKKMNMLDVFERRVDFAFCLAQHNVNRTVMHMISQHSSYVCSKLKQFIVH
jgi:hypothetical protein